MANVFGFEVPLPSLWIGTGQIAILLIILFLIILGVVTIFLVIHYRVYRYKIIVFEDIAGQGYQPVLRDRARLVKIGDGGEEVLFLRKKRVYRSAYNRKMGRNTLWFAVGPDGYWYNIVLGDLDAKMGVLDVQPVDRDLRYGNVTVRKTITERYRKVSFFEKYGVVLMSTLAIIIIIIGMWFLLDKMADISSTVASAVQKATELQEANQRIAIALENLHKTSGVVPG